MAREGQKEPRQRVSPSAYSISIVSSSCFLKEVDAAFFSLSEEEMRRTMTRTNCSSPYAQCLATNTGGFHFPLLSSSSSFFSVYSWETMTRRSIGRCEFKPDAGFGLVLAVSGSKVAVL